MTHFLLWKHCVSNTYKIYNSVIFQHKYYWCFSYYVFVNNYGVFVENWRCMKIKIAFSERPLHTIFLVMDIYFIFFYFYNAMFFIKKNWQFKQHKIFIRRKDFPFQSINTGTKFSVWYCQAMENNSVYIHRWKQGSIQYWLKAVGSHRAPRCFGFIQSRPWLLDWTHWLKGNFNDLLSQVLTRCWQTALCGTERGWWPKWTEPAGHLLLGWVKEWETHVTGTFFSET